MNLTDLNSKELDIISKVISTQIDRHTEYLDLVEKKVHGSEDFVQRLTAKVNYELPTLREFHVQLLTAKKKVRESEVINEN